MKEKSAAQLYFEEEGGRLERLAPPLLRWYKEFARRLPWRETPSPYGVWVSEIMLQQTRVEAVKGYYARFLKALPTVEALAGAEEDLLLKLWEGLGYYSRVRNLKKAAVEIMERYGGELPADHEKLLMLPGIGRYTAGAIASIAFGIPVPAVVGNVIRVLTRDLAWEGESGSDRFKRDLEEAVLPHLPAGQSGTFNQALMEIGATVCLPNGAPLCGECPLREECLAHLQQNETAYPVKPEKKSRRVEERTVFVLSAEREFALGKRSAQGLLAGMWELPGVQGHLSPDEAKVFLQNAGLSVVQVEALSPAVHIFSHVEWHMIGYRVICEKKTEGTDLVWLSPEEIDEKIALPSAFRAYRKELRNSQRK